MNLSPKAVLLTIFAAIILGAGQISAANPPLSCSGIVFPGSLGGCLDYYGDGWTDDSASAEAHCTDFTGALGGQILEVGHYCDPDIYHEHGETCIVDKGSSLETRLYFDSEDDDTNFLETSCVNFLGGKWLTMVAGSCNHQAQFGPPNTQQTVPACAEYTGAEWNKNKAIVDCEAKEAGLFTSEGTCGTDNAVGYCTLNKGDAASETELYYYTGESSTLQFGCETMMGGTWTNIEQQEDDLMPEAMQALISDDKVTVIPDSCDDDALESLIASNMAITFTPSDRSSSKGLIIYPGALVDPRAYSIAARMIAEEGFFVAIMPFPGLVPISDPFRANHVLTSHPEISDWAISGHSMGGLSASIYADSNPFDKIKALALWDSETPEEVDMSQSNLKGLAIFAPQYDKWETTLSRLPAASHVVTINGGNHKQFGFYVDKQGGYEASISREDQHELFVGATIHLLNRINVPEEDDFINKLYTTLPLNTAGFSKLAQKKVARLLQEDLGLKDIRVDIISDPGDFSASKSSFPEDDSSFLVHITAFEHQKANPTDIHLPPVYYDELKIKMKSQDAFVDQYGFAPVGKPRDCGQINKRILQYALARADRATRRKFKKSRVKLTYGEDFQATAGHEWLGQSIVLEEIPKSKNNREGLRMLTNTRYRSRFNLTASRLEVPIFVPAPFGGSFYCTVWSHTAAMKFLVDIGENFMNI